MWVRHGDTPGVVRLGSWGERVWGVVKELAESVVRVVGESSVVDVAVGQDEEAAT
jgi:hypothetical protein